MSKPRLTFDLGIVCCVTVCCVSRVLLCYIVLCVALCRVVLSPVFLLWKRTTNGSLTKDCFFLYWYWLVRLTSPFLFEGGVWSKEACPRWTFTHGHVSHTCVSPVDEGVSLHGTRRVSHKFAVHWLILMVVIPQHNRHTQEWTHRNTHTDVSLWPWHSITLYNLTHTCSHERTFSLLIGQKYLGAEQQIQAGSR